jgi:transketolase
LLLVTWYGIAIEAARELESRGLSVEVINIHTIKPLDVEAIVASATKTGAVVTAEEHNRIGGLGESIAGVLSRFRPTPIEMVAVNDSFGESGKPEELLIKYGLSTADVIKAAERAIARK